MRPEARRVRIDLAYDGTDFCGFQLQPGQRSVQGVVEAALAELHGGERVVLRGASRTDAGVHARRQVTDCLVRVRHDDAGLAYALRRLLPADLRPLAVRTTEPAFHSRKHALSKLYQYWIDRSPQGDPFAARYALHHPAALDDGRMCEGLARLPGRRDWTGFASPRGDQEDPVRELTRAELVRIDAQWTCLAFEGQGFLRYMVRNIVGTLIEIGKGRAGPDLVRDILDRREPDLAGPTAAPRGLHLVRVRYANDDLDAPGATCTIGGLPGGP